MGSKTRIIGIAAAIAASAALFAAPAQARTSINLSIGTGVPYGYVQPGYAYTQPGYVYSQPSYVYTQPSYVYTEPSYVYTQPSYIYYDNHGHGQRRHYNRGWSNDRDHDGVPNRFDRRPNNPRRY
ncbi:hypothetical protein [Ramlibacter sp. AN1133]|uniref:hypothetical protein n=1 Tax=Ramlibacter sp. AN1133 TaxID=3133429 RepID=UPI0030BBFA9C